MAWTVVRGLWSAWSVTPREVARTYSQYATTGAYTYRMRKASPEWPEGFVIQVLQQQTVRSGHVQISTLRTKQAFLPQ